MAKAVANGFPFAAVVTRAEVAKTVGTYFNTYGGNPIGCAVASAVLDVIKEEKLQENCHHVGTHILHRLAKLRDEMPDVIGDVRGKGLFIGLEMVQEKVSWMFLTCLRLIAICQRQTIFGLERTKTFSRGENERHSQSVSGRRFVVGQRWKLRQRFPDKASDVRDQGGRRFCRRRSGEGDSKNNLKMKETKRKHSVDRCSLS